MAIANIVAWDNGRGLSRDIDLLAQTLTRLQWTVLHNGHPERGVTDSFAARIVRRLRALGPAPYDLNIHLENPRPQFLGLARQNVLVPNQEWFLEKYRPYLRRIDRVWAKTRHAAEIFASMGCATDFIGWSGCDRLNPVARGGWLHVAGHSKAKGTETILDVWAAHPEWPTLTVVQHDGNNRGRQNIRMISERISDAQITHLLNSHLVHVATSEAEGYGHTLVEAMSVGAAIITTDAPPMNELVTPDRGFLVGVERKEKMRLGYRYFVDRGALEATISRALALPETELAAVGRRGRAWFDQNHREFPARLASVLQPREASSPLYATA